MAEDVAGWSVSIAGGADADLFVIDAGGALSFQDAPDFGAPGDGAEIRLQEPRRVMGEPNAAGHVDETVALLVLQKGAHTPADGRIIQVGEISANKLCVSGFEDVAFAPGFDETPSIFSQIQTSGGTDRIALAGARALLQGPAQPNLNLTACIVAAGHMDGHDASGFRVALEDADSWAGRAPETVGWAVMDRGAATDADGAPRLAAGAARSNRAWAAAEQGDAFNFGASPAAPAGMASDRANDAAIRAVTGAGIDIRVEEDRALNVETGHAREDLHRAAFEAGKDIWGTFIP